LLHLLRDDEEAIAAQLVRNESQCVLVAEEHEAAGVIAAGDDGVTGLHHRQPCAEWEAMLDEAFRVSIRLDQCLCGERAPRSREMMAKKRTSYA
jgi:hypothetical protein